MTDQGGYILRNFPQRKSGDRENHQPVIKIVPEVFIFHHLGQIAVGSRNQPNVNSDSFRAAQPFECLFLPEAI